MSRWRACLRAGWLSWALIDPAWIEQAAFGATGNVSIRRRKLPAEHAVCRVIGLALFRHMPLWQLVQEMVLMLDGQDLSVPSSSVQARQRLGAETLVASVWLAPRCLGTIQPVHDVSVLALAAGLRSLDQSFTMFDRAYFSAAFLIDWQPGIAGR